MDASAKLKWLELLLPKLQKRGHRVRIFSPFLDMLDIVEDCLDGMQFRYQRLDGSISSLNKQKRIDEFNAPDSPLFAFLLSTRAGGVGINLAGANIAIKPHANLNPHQDIQSLSRAHHTGQSMKDTYSQWTTRRFMQSCKSLKIHYSRPTNLPARLYSAYRRGHRPTSEVEPHHNVPRRPASVTSQPHCFHRVRHRAQANLSIGRPSHRLPCTLAAVAIVLHSERLG